MAVSVISTQQLNMELTEITDVIVTDIVQDKVVGDWVRDIRIMGGAPEGVEPQSVLILQLKLRSPTKTPLQITSPTSEF